MAISNWLRSALFSHRRSLPPASLATHHSPLTTRHYSGPLTTSFCTFLRTAWPEPHAVRSIRGEPGRSANRQAFPSPPYPASSQDLRDPHIRQAGFRVSKTTHSAHRRSAWAVRVPASHTELPKALRTIPTYSVYGTIARLLRASPESGLFLMA